MTSWPLPVEFSTMFHLVARVLQPVCGTPGLLSSPEYEEWEPVAIMQTPNPGGILAS